MQSYSHNPDLDKIPHTNWLGIAMGLGLGALASYHLFKLPTVLPLLLNQYNYDLFIAGSFISIYPTMGLLFSVILGRRLQSYGLSRFLLIAGSLLIIGSLVTLVFPNNAIIILICRGIEGIGFSILAIAGPVLATKSANIKHKTMAITLFATWIPLGQLMVLGVAHPFIDTLGWPLIWWVGIALTAVIVLMACYANSSIREASDKRISTDTLPLKKIEKKQRLALILVAIIFMLWSTEVFAMLTWLPQFLVEVYKLGGEDTILIYGLPAMLILIFNLIGGYLLKIRFPLILLLVLGLTVQVIVWFILPLMNNPTMGLIGLTLFGIGAGITPACLFNAPSLILGPINTGARAFGIVMTGRSLGVLLGPILVPQFLLLSGGWYDIGPFLGIILISAIAVTCGLQFIIRGTNVKE